MNPTTWTVYRQYLDKVGEPSAAAALTLADALQTQQDAPQPAAPPAVAPTGALLVAEAARRLKVAPATVYRLIWAGELKYHRIGRAIRVLAEDVEALQQPPKGQGTFGRWNF
jgi:excisionase family DNA binding protein